MTPSPSGPALFEYDKERVLEAFRFHRETPCHAEFLRKMAHDTAPDEPVPARCPQTDHLAELSGPAQRRPLLPAGRPRPKQAAPPSPSV